jgi:hypothetical protein
LKVFAFGLKVRVEEQHFSFPDTICFSVYKEDEIYSTYPPLSCSADASNKTFFPDRH